MHMLVEQENKKSDKNVVEAHGYGFRSTVVSGEHSRSKTTAIIVLVLLRECSPLTTVKNDKIS